MNAQPIRKVFLLQEHKSVISRSSLFVSKIHFPTERSAFKSASTRHDICFLAWDRICDCKITTVFGLFFVRHKLFSHKRYIYCQFKRAAVGSIKTIWDSRKRDIVKSPISYLLSLVFFVSVPALSGPPTQTHCELILARTVTVPLLEAANHVGQEYYALQTSFLAAIRERGIAVSEIRRLDYEGYVFNDVM